MDRRCDHASPTIGAAIGFITSEPMPVSKRIANETGENGGDCHELRTEALNRAFDGSLFNIVRAMDFVREKMTVQKPRAGRRP